MYHPEMRDYHYVSYKGQVMIFQPHDGTRLSGQIEKAAHGFMADYQQIDKQHDFTTNAGKVVESCFCCTFGNLVAIISRLCTLFGLCSFR